MKWKIRYLVFGVLAAAVLILLAVTIPGPLLYSIEEDRFTSQYHLNAEALKYQPMNSTTDIIPEIQALVDFSSPVSLSLRVHDIEQARRDLARFERSQGTIKNLIVRLDMKESEIQELERDTALQREILESLINTSVTIESLQLLEIQYQSEDNKDMATTIRLQGDELRKKVKGLNARYRNITGKVSESGRKFGLNTTKNEESAVNVDQIIQEIENPAARPTTTKDPLLVPGDDRVSLFIRPDSGHYRDVIEYMGISLTLEGNKTLRANKVPIVLYMDNLPIATVETDKFGYYNVRVPIERAITGEHDMYVRSPTSRSTNRTLNVLEMGSVTNLSLGKPDLSGNTNCSGYVMADYPVRSASVQIIWDETHVLVTKTNGNGMFVKKIQFPEGRHTVVAKFSGDEFPLTPSQSPTEVIEVAFSERFEPDYGLIGMVLFSIGIFIFFLAAARWYIRRMTVKKVRVAQAEDGSTGGTDELPHEPDSALTLEDLFEEDGDDLVIHFTRLVREQGLKAASYTIYEQIAMRVARDMRIKRYRSLTAREMSRSCRGKPYCGAFSRFVKVYERVRYSGQVSARDQAIFQTAITSTEELMEGEDH